MLSSIASMSASVIVGDRALDLAAPSTGLTVTSGSTSNTAANFRSVAGLDLDRLDARAADRTQVFLVHRIAVALADQLGDGVAVHLAAVLLLDDRQRHLALAEAAHVGGARQVAQAAIDFAGHARVRNFHFDAALEAGGRRSL